MAEKIISQENYEQEVLQAERPILLDFWADWCAPCKMVAPLLEELAAEHDDIDVGKINIDEQVYLSRLFGIEAIPTLVLMKDGQPIKAAFGMQGKAQLEELLRY